MISSVVVTVASLPDDFGAIFGERHLIAVGLDRARLIAGRPGFAAAHIAQEDIGAPAVAGDVLAPARDRDIVPAAVARSRRRHHHRIASIRQKMGARHARMRRRIVALGVGHQACVLRRCARLFRRRPRHGDIARHALLQQKFRRLHDRFGMKPRAHPAVLQRVGDADDGHRLMMRHVGADDGDLRAFGQAGARIVERLVPAIGAACADLRPCA